MRALAQARPHQLVHQLAVIAVLSGFGAASVTSIAAAVALAGLATLALMLAGDLSHREIDEAAGRGRVTRLLGPRTVPLAIAASLSALVGLALAFGGLACLAAVLGVFAGTALYNGAKARRRPGWSALGRAGSGAALVAVYWTWFDGIATPHVGRLALALGILDLAGNLAGDLRDIEPDRRAGLATLPLLVGARTTRVTSLVLTLLAIAVVVPAVMAPGRLAGLGAGIALASAIITAWVPPAWKHGAAHGPKLLLILIIGQALVAPSAERMWVATGAIGALWIAAYRLYVAGSARRP